MATANVTLDVSGVIRQAATLRTLKDREIAQVQTRVVSGLKRRIVPEAARLTSDGILNLTPRQISPYLFVETFADGIRLRGKSQRLPVSAFKPTWGGPTSAGVTVTFWRDAGPLTLVHTFIRKGTKGVWQRVPGKRSKTQRVGVGRDSSRQVVRPATGLVSRLPIVQRKGPSFARAIFERKHGDIYPDLIEFSQTFVRDEADRLVKILEFK
jgi:hypothetical protein